MSDNKKSLSIPRTGEGENKSISESEFQQGFHSANNLNFSSVPLQWIFKIHTAVYLWSKRTKENIPSFESQGPEHGCRLMYL